MSTATTLKPQPQKSYLTSIIIIGALFFIFGFVTWINGILIPYLKIACELKSDTQSFLVATAFFIAYLVMSIPSSYVLKATGYKKGMSLGLLVMAVGALIFIPAAQTRNFNLFLVGLFIIGTGLAILQTASNPYISIIGPIESAASRISIMGICNKLAGILASVIFGFIALKDADALTARIATMGEAEKAVELDQLAARVINPYIIITIVLVVLAIAVYYSSLPDIKDDGTGETASSSQPQKKSIFQYPHLFLGVLAMFLYVGVEVMSGDTIISYGQSLGISMTKAKFFTSATLVCMLVGYIIGIFAIPKLMSQETSLKIFSVMGALFTTLALTTSGFTSVFFIALLGLANSLLFPALFPLAINGLGKFTKLGSGLMVSSFFGGAILPLVYGAMVDSSTSAAIASGVDAVTAKASAAQNSYWIMIPAYLYILYFGIKGYKAGKKA
ncbi:MAG: sugar MFS transporter [Chitinophagaceae bacterium]|nr:sugar MFS transporter [Chitinophagaceae bacterium]MCW5927608.1 sugar MFS transporter [Chitinophagaceae bacterium]